MGTLDAFLSSLGSLGHSISDFITPTLEQLGLSIPKNAPIISPVPDSVLNNQPSPSLTKALPQFFPGTPQSLEAPISNASSSSISPLLLSTLAHQENNNFLTNTLNPESSAAGLFQFNPITLDELQRQGFNQGQRIDPFNATESAQAASFYLDYLLKKFGNLPLALAAYNAGPGNVNKYGGIPPFPETQNYVKDIMDVLEGR